MKKFIMVVICIFLFGCDNKNLNAEIKEIEKYNSYSFTTNVLYKNNIYEPINSYEDFIKKTDNELFGEDVVNYLKKYDINYFKNSSLIMIYIESGGFVPAKVSNVEIENNIEITIEQEKYGSLDEVLSGNLFFIEINKNINNKDILVHYILGHEQTFTTSRNILRTMQFLKYEKYDEVIYHYFKTLDTNEEVMLYTKDNKTLFEIDYKVGQNYDFKFSTNSSDPLTTKELSNRVVVVGVSVSDSVKNEKIYNPSKTYNEIIYTSKDYMYNFLKSGCNIYACKNVCIPSLKIEGKVYTIQQAYDQFLINETDISDKFEFIINKINPNC